MSRPRAPPALRRRRFLRRLGAVGVGALAGCVGGGNDDPTSTGTGTATSTATRTRTASPRPTATDGPTDPGALAPPRRLDFRAGTWDVRDRSGTQVGTSVVRSHSDGNLLLEDWSGADGRAALGMHYYDFASESWVRTVVSDTGTVTVVEGGYRDGAMRLSGRRTDADGTTVPVRSSYAPREDGSVRQRRETSTDDGETWSVVFEGIDEPRGDAGPEPPPTATASENADVDPATLAPRRQFDFWVGTWDVKRPWGTTVVRAVIQSLVGGNLILENWDGVVDGKSVNYWDPAGEQWVKRWVPDNGNKVVMTGGYRDGAMRLDGTLSARDGEVLRHRASFTPNDDGTVTQLVEIKREDEETWSPWEGIYHRVGG